MSSFLLSFGRVGFGTLASWLPDVICVLTGNLDSEGGLMWANPEAGPAAQQDWGTPRGFDRWLSRVRGAPEALGQFPLSCLAEEIDTPGPGQITPPEGGRASMSGFGREATVDEVLDGFDLVRRLG